MFICKFCKKPCKNKNGLGVHQSLCLYNPNKRTNGMTGRVAWNNGMTKESSPKIQSMASNTSKTLTGVPGRKHDLASRKNLSEHAKRRELGGHTSKIKLHYLKKDGTVVYLQSSYEINFATILDKLNIDWLRPNPLKWIDEIGDEHRYYPDFQIGDIYIDTKNDYLAVKDKPKIDKVISQNNVDIRIVTKNLITEEYILALKA